uniref:NADH dehydrogenase subunit 6 n=1 Tax=Penthe kochi TaxID=2952706 RepID=UPI00211598A0|nr:NADH dehydrogenase subunit 6 [Penthe kochi]USG58932.1 NADH dehydrogenase subunit 6 [Penthe kochi]
MIYLFLLNLYFSMIFLMMIHPLSLGLILLIQSLMISMITGNFCLNFWFSYILFLVMIGGMLILFMYMTSIASNEMFNLNIKNLIFMLILTIILMTMFYKNLNFNLNLNIINSDSLNLSSSEKNYMIIMKFIFNPSLMILLFMIIYLFITLIAVVKITQYNQGPLRFMN